MSRYLLSYTIGVTVETDKCFARANQELARRPRALSAYVSNMKRAA